MTKRRARAGGLMMATLGLFILQAIIAIFPAHSGMDAREASETSQRIFICIVVLITGTQIILAMDDD